MYLHILIVSSVLYSAHSLNTPQIEHINNQLKDVGETVEFACKVKNAVDSPVSWFKYYKNGTKQLVAGYTNKMMQKMSDSKYSLRLDKPNSYTLQIKNVTEDDIGYYECQIPISGGKTIQQKTKLSLRVPAKITSISENQTKNVGETVKLICGIEYYQKPEVDWWKLNKTGKRDIFFDIDLPDDRHKVILDSENSLILEINDVQESDAGAYQCFITNEDAKIDFKRTTMLNVLKKKSS